MRDETVSFHLTDTKTTLSGTSLRRLSRKRDVRTSTSGKHLILDHVLQALIVYWTEKYVRLKDVAGEAAVQKFFSRIRKTSLHQYLSALDDAVASEGGTETTTSVEETRLTVDKLDHLTDRHARWETVRIHDHVGTNS